MAPVCADTDIFFQVTALVAMYTALAGLRECLACPPSPSPSPHTPCASASPSLAALACSPHTKQKNLERWFSHRRARTWVEPNTPQMLSRVASQGPLEQPAREHARGGPGGRRCAWRGMRRRPLYPPYPAATKSASAIVVGGTNPLRPIFITPSASSSSSSSSAFGILLTRPSDP